MSQSVQLYEYLQSRFSDLDGAKVFYRHWCDELDEEIEGFGDIGMRSMAAHCSAALEGNQLDLTKRTDYASTRYGSEIYLSFFW